MDGFFVLWALALVAAFLLGPIAFFLVLDARRRLSALETARNKSHFRLRGIDGLVADAAPRQSGPDTNHFADAPVGSDSPEQTAEASAPLMGRNPADFPTVETSASPPIFTLPPIIQRLLLPEFGQQEDRAKFDGPATVSANTQDFASVRVPVDTTLQTPASSFEEALGTRWAVWVGGIALAFGALLLVRYSIEMGFFGPSVRLGMGAVLSACLICGGEFLRRRELPTKQGREHAAYIPGVLTAAGTVAAFGVIYAAHALYGFIGPAAALVLLGATGIATMVAAALHGPALAGLGLAGAMVTPLLVETHAPIAWPLVSFLGVVAGSGHMLAHWRGWRWLSYAAAAGGAVWGLAMLLGPVIVGQPEFFLAKIAQIVVQCALAGYFLGTVGQRQRPAESIALDLPTSAIMVGFGGLAILTLAWGAEYGYFGTMWIMSAGAYVALFTSISFFAASLAVSAVIAGAIVPATLILWPVLTSANPEFVGYFQHYPPVDAGSLYLFAICASLAVVAVSFVRLWRSTTLRLPVAAFYCLAAAVTPGVALVFVYFSLTQTRQNLVAAASALALAGLFALSAVMFARRHKATNGPAAKLALGACATAVVANVALALIFSTQDGTLTIALALTALGAASVAVWLDLTALRHCVTALGLLICARFAVEPRIIGPDIIAAPAIFNWLLFGYGVPAVSFALAGWLLRQRRDDTSARVADALAILFAALLVFLEIRHSLNGGVIDTRSTGLVEQALFTVTSLAFGIVLVRLDAARANIVFCYASLAAGAAGLVLASVSMLLRFNPIVTDAPLQGSVPINSLLLAYALPAMLAGLLAWFARQIRPFWYWAGAGLLAALLTAAFFAFEIRAAFHGASIGAYRGLYLMEAGVDVIACLLLAIGAAHAAILYGPQRPDNRIGYVSCGFAALAVAIAVPGLGLLANPIFAYERITGIIFNPLLVAYGLPCLLAAYLAFLGRQVRPAILRPAATVGAVVALFAYANLEVRHLFQGPDIRLFPRGFLQDERVAYSAVWLALGIALLAIGIWRTSREARLGSAVLVVMSVVKIFIFDLAGLEGILRALSFIGLGLVLIAIGLVYQKFVFNKSEAPAK